MIKTWRQRCEEHPDHDGIVSDGMIQARMQEEIDELRTVIEQAQEPVAWMQNTTAGCYVIDHYDEWHCIPLYTAPQQRKPLTDKEIVKITADPCLYIRGGDYRIVIARAIEAAHGIKGKA